MCGLAPGSMEVSRNAAAGSDIEETGAAADESKALAALRQENEELRRLAQAGAMRPPTSVALAGEAQTPLIKPLLPSSAHPPVGIEMGLTAGVSGSAWQNRLPPDMRRAAPEIYRSLRTSGSGSVRDWLNGQHAGVRSPSEWSQLWHTATEVDFLLGQAQDDYQITKLLATDDQLELGLRQLASFAL